MRMKMEEDKGKVLMVEEVMRGCEFADQLKQILEFNNSLTKTKTTTSFVQHLVNNVIASFSNILFLLHKDKHIQKEVSSIDSVLFKQSSKGCHKKRNNINIQLTCEKVTQIPADDGHQWRKYGQKKIINSPYSRNYYRCTHKFDQRCLATKQVHRIQQNPPLYKTTYYGHHTCGNLSNPYNDTSSTLLSFNNTFPTPTKQQCPFLSSSSSSSYSSNIVEDKEQVPSNSLDDDNSMPSTDPTLDTSISTRNLNTLSPTLEVEFDHHNDMLYGFLYDTVVFDEDFFQPFVGF